MVCSTEVSLPPNHQFNVTHQKVTKISYLILKNEDLKREIIIGLL